MTVRHLRTFSDMAAPTQELALPPTLIQIPISSHVEQIWPTAASNGRASLYFFLLNILGSDWPLEAAQFIQELRSRPSTVLIPRLWHRAFAADVVLWNSVQAIPRRISTGGIELGPIPIPDPVRWLYGGSLSIIPPVDDAPDLILTCDRQQVVGPVLEILR
jgi:hypothetical protein